MTGAEGEQPALLYPFTAHWRWTSRDDWETEIRDLAGRLGTLTPGTRVGFRWRPRPSALTHDRALLRAGLVSVPVEDRAPVGVERWLGEHGPEGAEAAELAAEGGQHSEPAAEGCALVVPSGEASREWDADARQAAARAVREALDPLRAARSLAFLSGCPAQPVERAFLEWSLEDDAALVLAGDRERAADNLVWSRPTVACLDAARLAAVEKALRAAAGLRRLRRRFRRLEAILLPSEAAGAAADRELWNALEVRLVPLEVPLP